MATKDKRIVVILEEEQAIAKRLKEIERERRKLSGRQAALVEKRCQIAARKLKGHEVVPRGSVFEGSDSSLNYKTGRMLKATKGNRCLVDFGDDGTHEMDLLEVMAADEELWEKLCKGEQPA